MVVAQHNAVEAGERILRQHGEGEVAGHQMGGDGVVARAAVTDGETGLDLTGHADLLEADDAALVLPDAQQEDPGGAVLGDRKLV